VLRNRETTKWNVLRYIISVVHLLINLTLIAHS